MPIRVFLVEDSPIALQILSNIINLAPDMLVVGSASSGTEALLQIPEVKPDVICTDLYMKGMDGLELTQQIMARFPKPILVISVAVGEGQEQNTFQLLEAGAIDILPKPGTGLPNDYAQAEILNKIRVLSGVKVFTRPIRPQFVPSVIPTPPIATGELKIMAIGASTGGPQAVFRILQFLPRNFYLPILCTQHISSGFLEGLVSWMNKECAVTVKTADNGETPQVGTVYYAPDGFNLELDRRGRLIHTPQENTEIHCPSINVMFRSVALHHGANALGILLTGMGEDGAKGLHSIALAGGTTIVQDEASSVVFGMPKAAIALGAAQQILEIEAIGKFVVGLTT